MKVLLVNPPIPHKMRMLEFSDEAGRKAMSLRVMVGPPLALNELAGVIPDEEILILDQKTEQDQNPDYDCLAHLEKTVRDFQPDFVGFTCITAQYNSVKKMLELIKKIDPSIITQAGGLHPTLCTEDFADSKADIIAVGLGKRSFRDVIRELRENGSKADFSHIPGLAFPSAAGMRYTKKLSEFSYQEIKEHFIMDEIMPNRALTDRYDYIIPYEKKRIQYISTSQGCTHKCNFCTIWPVAGGQYFHKSVDLILREIKHMERYPIIRFCDANTFGDLGKARQLFTRILEEGLDHHQYIVDVRTDFVIRHPEIMELAYRAGVRVAICGLESVNEEELKNYGKNSTVQDTIDALRILNQLGMKVNGNYMVTPDYVERDFEALGQFVEENAIFHSGFTILTPFPGTAQWEMYKDRITISDFDYYNLTNAVFDTKLPEPVFYDKVTELYKLAAASRRKFIRQYGSAEEKERVEAVS